MNSLKAKKHFNLSISEKRLSLYISSLFTSKEDILFLCACLSSYRKQKYKQICLFDLTSKLPCFYKLCGDVHLSIKWKYIDIIKKMMTFTSCPLACQQFLFPCKVTSCRFNFLTFFLSYLGLKRNFFCFMDALDIAERDFFSELLFSNKKI